MIVDYNTDTKLYSIIEITPDDMMRLAAACDMFARQLTQVGELPGGIDEMIKVLDDIEEGCLAK